MQPQGTAPTNTAYYLAMTEQISQTKNCAVLQANVNSIMASLQAEKNAIDDQLAAIAPMLALLSPPGSNLGQIVTWITDYINLVLAPVVAPQTVMFTQLTELAAQVATLTTAINDAASQIPSCSITIPPLT